MARSASLFPPYVMRALYLINFALLGSDVWPALLRRETPWEPVPGVALRFWAARSALSALGMRYPLAMLPLLLLQRFYKIVWLAAVGLPLQAAGHPAEMTMGLRRRRGAGHCRRSMAPRRDTLHRVAGGSMAVTRAA